MDRETAKSIVKQKEPDFLRIAPKRVGGKITYICPNPNCKNGSGKIGDGIVKYKEGYKCFSCGRYMDIIELWKLSQGISDDKTAFEGLYNHYGIVIDTTQGSRTDSPKEKQRRAEQVQDFTEYYLSAHENIYKTAYHRGLSKETLEKYKIGYDESWRHPKVSASVPTSPRLIIPVTKHSYIARDTRDNLTEEQNRYKKQKVAGKEGANWIFNITCIDESEKPIIVVEGEIDALSVLDAGGQAVGLGSTGNANKFIEYLETHRPTKPIILSLDNDKAGKETQKKISEALEKLNIDYCLFDICGAYKDPNEFLMADRTGFFATIDKIKNVEDIKDLEKEQYIKENATSSFIESFFNGISESVNTPCISTGFKQLDKLLDGGFYEGLYIFGAIPSLGKTTLVLQIADNIAQQGQDVLIFSLEMARAELISKSISRHTCLEVLEHGGNLGDAKTSRGITAGARYKYYSDTEKRLIKTATAKYSEYAKHIYISQGVGNIGAEQIVDTTTKHIRLTGKKPIVIIDYLQILAPYDMRASDKQNTDKAVLELKRLSRDYKIPVVVVSSFNRTNYKEKVSMEAFKESGAIEYGSDVLLGLQLKGVEKKDFDVDKAKKKNPREIELRVLKNRNGATGEKVDFEYYTLFNFFKELRKRETTAKSNVIRK